MGWREGVGDLHWRLGEPGNGLVEAKKAERSINIYLFGAESGSWSGILSRVLHFAMA